MATSFKLKCFISHLIIAGSITALSLLLIFTFWYPDPLQAAVGLSSMLLTLMLSSMIIGPILTFILAKEGKKGFVFDLMIIATIQVLTLLYVMYNLERDRPVWIAFDSKHFELVQKHSVSRPKYEKIAGKYSSDPSLKHQLVAVRIAKDVTEESAWLQYEIEKSIAPGMRPILYEPINNAIDRVIKAKLPIINLNKFNDKQNVSDILSTYPGADSFLPLRTSKLDMTVLVSSESKKIIGVVDLRPW